MRNVLVRKVKTSNGFTFHYSFLNMDKDFGELCLVEQDIENISNEIKALNSVVNYQRKLRKDLKDLEELRDLILKDTQNT